MEVLTLLLLSNLCLFGNVFSTYTKTRAERFKSLHFKDSQHNPAYDIDALFDFRTQEELASMDDEETKRKRLSVLVRSHDRNVNGFIEKEELYEWILFSLRLVNLEEAVERFAAEDENKDGKISFGDILKSLHEYSDEEIEAFEKEGKLKTIDDEYDNRDYILNDKQRFKVADLDHDGLLNEEEYAAYINPSDYSHMRGFEVERTMEGMDEDKNGFVSFEEFSTESEDNQDARADEKFMFDDLDKDKDGQLTSDEVSPWAIFDITKTAREEADHLLEECDENKDGQLSVEEIVNKEKAFLDSQATSYGRHLEIIKEEL